MKDKLKASHPLVKSLIATVQFIWVAFNNITAVTGYFVLLGAIQPFKWLDRQKYDRYERWLFSCQFKFCASWGFENGWDVKQCGEFPKLAELTDTNCIVVANHQNTVDISALMYGIALVPGFNGALNWVMDAILKFCSFGWVSWAHNDFFIWQAQDARTFKWLAPAPPEQVREIELKRFEGYIKKNFTSESWRQRRWLTIFPEGGFKYKRMANSCRYAEKNDLPLLEHCTYPRHFGIHSATKSGDFKYMIDATIAYSDEKSASLVSWWFGRSQSVRIYWRVIKLQPNQDEESFRKELFELWQEKDALLAHYAEHQSFPANNNQGEAKTYDADLSLFEVMFLKGCFAFVSWIGLMMVYRIVNILLV